MTDHVIRVLWDGGPSEQTVYRGECSCGWATAFRCTKESIVVTQAEEHAKRIQSAAQAVNAVGFGGSR